MRKQLIILVALILADIVNCSELKVEVPSESRSQHTRQGPSSDATANETSSTTEADALEKRKVWSRWGKWSVCSVTCGTGSVVRRRLCVAGRCAPGEREEQRRPCSRTPCSAPANLTGADDAA